jgi:hypothetical protein
MLSLNSKRGGVTRRHRTSDASDTSSSGGVLPSSDTSLVQGSIPAAVAAAAPAEGGLGANMDEDGRVQGWSSDEGGSSPKGYPRSRGHTRGTTQQPGKAHHAVLGHLPKQQEEAAGQDGLAAGSAAGAADADQTNSNPPAPAAAAATAGPASPAGSEGFSFAAAGCASGSPAGEDAEQGAVGPPGLLPGAAGKLGGWWGTPENSCGDVGVAPEGLVGQ